jgi:hypothetical protein
MLNLEWNLGDLNASKLYEVPFMAKPIGKKERKRITNKTAPLILKI